ncbi:MAG: hydroxymethylglutaryl-CoA synthase [Candidatus Caldarchaeum sp.]
MPKINSAAIVGYGLYIPRYRIRGEELARVWGKSKSDLPVKEKAFAGPDEDTVTMSVEAARYALKRAGVDPSKISAVHVGTESKPYAVKPSGTLVAEILGASRNTTSADLEFACKAGTEAVQMVTALVELGRIEYGLAIGADTAQGRPGDALEYTAASGAAAFVIGKADNNCIAKFEYSVSVVTDTPDFWRRSYERYPVHASRFTGEPAYFHHTLTAVNTILEENGYSVDDIDYFVFHQPNVKFPLTVAKLLSIPSSKIAPGMVADVVGNTYAACSMLGLAKVLDIAVPGQRILMTSYGSGAGSDSFIITVCEGIVEKRGKAPTFQQLLSRNKQVDYATYLKFRDKIRV